MKSGVRRGSGWSADGGGEDCGGIEALAAWNGAGRLPLKNGFARPLPLPRRVRLDAGLLERASGGRAGGVFSRQGDATVWATRVRVADAWELRLHLADVDLPSGARMWVYGADGRPRGPFGPELVDPEGGLWTPSVRGPALHLEVEIPDAALAGESFSFTPDRVLELVRLDAVGKPTWELAPKEDVSCLQDVSCFGPADWSFINGAKRAIAQLFFVVGGEGAVCTGGLLNNTEQDGTPYLLTANHCFATQSAASSLQATWDAHTTSCGGSFDPDTFPVTNGSTLLATGSAEDGLSDFTLVRMNSIPPNRIFLGWNANQNAVTGSTPLHRISHPVNPNTGTIFVQQYSRSPGKLGSFFLCGQPLNNPDKYHHHKADIGGTFPGSSGAPLVLDGPDGQVVGQLLGACGSNTGEGCDNVLNDEVDGNFFTTFPFLEAFLAPSDDDPPPPFATWISSGALPGFEAQVRITPSGAAPVQGAGVTQCIVEAICVQGALAGRPEVFIKVIGPRPNDFLWTQLSRFTPSQVEVWLRRISTGQTNYYSMEAVGPFEDNVSGLQDRMAFVP